MARTVVGSDSPRFSSAGTEWASAPEGTACQQPEWRSKGTHRTPCHRRAGGPLRWGQGTLAPWARRRPSEPDPAMTREAVKEATWALLGIEVEQVVRPCLFRRFKRILMVRDPEGSRKEALMGSRHGGPS